MLLFLLSTLTYIIGIALVASVVMQRKEPSSTLAWVLVIIFLPIIGAFLYLWIGYGRVHRRVRRKQRSNAAFMAHLQRLEQTLIEYKIVHTEPPDVPVQSELVQITEGIGAPPVTHGNRFRLLTEPDSVFQELVQAIAQAQDSIHMEYYIFRRDKTGKAIRDLLIKAAERGVEVRLLVDGIGSWTLGDVFIQPLKRAGAQFARFLPVTFLGRPWHVNLRNHRKIAVFDGAKAYIGSPNIGDEYRYRKGETTDFYDYLVECTGPMVQQLQEVFAEDWFFAMGENILLDRYFPLPERKGTSLGQVVYSGPDEQRFTLHEMICAAIHTAQRSVRITSPYFIPDQALMVALRTAALRGVTVEIMLARHLPKHEFIALHAGRSYYTELLQDGIHIHEYIPGFLHAKSIAIDSAWASVGTANMDIRSFRLNFEVNINLYSKDTVRVLEETFEKNLKSCERIDLATFLQRPFLTQCLENTLRVLSPIL